MEGWVTIGVLAVSFIVWLVRLEGNQRLITQRLADFMHTHVAQHASESRFLGEKFEGLSRDLRDIRGMLNRRHPDE